MGTSVEHRHGDVVVTLTPLLTEMEYATDSRNHVPAGSEAMYDSYALVRGDEVWHRLYVTVSDPPVERAVLAHATQFERSPAKAFKLTWTETHKCEAIVETEELAGLLGIDVERLLDMDPVRLSDLVDEKLVDRSDLRPEADVSCSRTDVEEDR